jgi:hypothetical protein
MYRENWTVSCTADDGGSDKGKAHKAQQVKALVELSLVDISGICLVEGGA